MSVKNFRRLMRPLNPEATAYHIEWGPLCGTAIDPIEMTQWVIRVILAVLADVGYGPVSVGNSDIADVGEVPLPTKVQRNKMTIQSRRQRWTERPVVPRRRARALLSG